MGLKRRIFFFLATIATLVAVLTMTFPRQSGVLLFHLHTSGLKTAEATTPNAESCWLTDPGRECREQKTVVANRDLVLRTTVVLAFVYVGLVAAWFIMSRSPKPNPALERTNA